MLGGALVDAEVLTYYQISVNILSNYHPFQVFAEADMYAGVAISGSVNQAVCLSILLYVDMFLQSALSRRLSFVLIRYARVIFYFRSLLDVTNSTLVSTSTRVLLDPYCFGDQTLSCTCLMLLTGSQTHSLRRKNFYSADFDFGGSCFSSVTESSASGSSRKRRDEPLYAYEAHGSGGQGTTIEHAHDLDIPAYVAVEKRSLSPRKQSLSGAARVQQPTISWTVKDANSTTLSFNRRAVPFLPGYLVCPDVGDEIVDDGNGATDCMCYSDNNIDAEGATGQNCIALLFDTILRSKSTGQFADILARGFFDTLANTTEAYEDELINGQYNNITADARGELHSVVQRGSGSATLLTCPAYSLDMSGYSSTLIGTFFDVANPATLNPTFGTYNPWPPNVFTDSSGNPILTTEENGNAIFAREHVYEMSMGTCSIVWQFRI